MRKPDINATVQQLFADASDGSREALLQLHRLGVPLDQTVYSDGSTLLHDISSLGDAGMAQLLLRLLSDNQYTPAAAAAAAAAVNARDNQQHTPLWLAAWNGDLRMLSILLEAGADPSAAAADGTCPLHLAAASGSTVAVQLLLAAGALLGAQAQDRRTALDWALAAGQAGVVQQLLDAGGDTQLQSRSVHVQLLFACLLGQQQQALELLKAGATPHAVTQSGVSALELAVRSGAVNIVKALVTLGADTTAPCSLGVSLLEAAAASSHLEVVQQLLVPLGSGSAAAAQPVLEAALHAAVAHGHAPVVGVLLKAGAVPTSLGPNGLPPLHQALLCQHAAVVELLLSWRGPAGVTKCNDAAGSMAEAPSSGVVGMQPAGSTPPEEVAAPAAALARQQAAAASDADAPDDRAGGAPATPSNPILQQRDQYGRTPVYVAAEQGLLGMVQLLVEAGASCRGNDSNGSSALHVAAARGHVDTFSYMLRVEINRELAALSESSDSQQLEEDSNEEEEQQQQQQQQQQQEEEEGSDDSDDLEQQQQQYAMVCDAKDVHGMTLLNYACAAGCPAITSMLVKAGAYPLIGDKQQRTPMFHACNSGCTECIELLTSDWEGGDIFERDVRGCGPLHFAAASGNDAVVAVLLEPVLDMGSAHSYWKDQAGQLGVTALHLAAAAGHSEVVRQLVAAGAPVDAVDASGSTPLHLAYQNRHQGVVQLLLEAAAALRRC
jgi:ankyrin repeat protein